MTALATTIAESDPAVSHTLQKLGTRAGREIALLPRQTTPLVENRHLQRLIFVEACKKTTKPIALSALARAWCILEQTSRQMRGIPSPGQLRPDLDPVQLKRAMKRARGRQPIEIANELNASAAMLGDDDEPVSETPPAAAKPAKGKAITKRELDTSAADPPK